MKRVKLLILSLTVALSLMSAPATPAMAFDFFPKASTCSGVSADSAVCQQAKAQGKDENPAVHAIGITASVMALLAGLLAAFMIIIGGISYITSAGNTEATGKAKKRIVNALVGLALTFLAWTIIRLITDWIIQ
jgi:hypothetical protein